VAYDDRIDVVVPSTPATREARRVAAEAVRSIEARGATDLCQGWLRGCEQVELHLADDQVGRCLLLTDGQANHGTTDETEIVTRADALRVRGIATSTFGLGAGFDERLLRRMAEAGGGSFRFIEGPSEIPAAIAGEVGEVLHVAARDVALVVEAGGGVEVDCLNGFPCRVEGDVRRVELVLRLTFPAGEVGDAREVGFRGEDREGVLRRASRGVLFRWAEDTENEHQDRDRSVDRRVAALAAARAYQEALERNREGDYAGARRVIQAAARDISRYAGDDPVTLGTLGTLRLQIDEVAREMDSVARKRGYATATGTLSSRSAGRPSRLAAAGRNVVLLPTSALRSLVDATVPPLAVADPELFGDMVLDGRLSGVDDAAQAGAILEASAEDDLTVAALRLVPDARVRVVVTGQRLVDGRSSHWDEDRRTAVVSLAGLEGDLREIPRAFVAGEIVFHALRLLGPEYEPERLGHVETRGCLFDFSRTHATTQALLAGGDVCPQCRDKLGSLGRRIDRLERLVTAIRALADGASLEG
jgi:Ca-activated chloride channel family protein